VGKFENCHFENARVDLHAGAYIGCTFERCELIFDGRPVHLDSNRFSGCSWNFAGPAAATIAVLELLCREDPNFGRYIGLRLGLVSEYAN
jgi:hypothetical protein